jgi:hypothetical protein
MRVGVVGSMIIVVIAAIKRPSDADSQITFDGDNGDIGEGPVSRLWLRFARGVVAIILKGDGPDE